MPKLRQTVVSFAVLALLAVPARGMNAEQVQEQNQRVVVEWAQPEAALATRENLIVYRTDGTFRGSGNMTRGDTAIIIYRLFQKIW